MNGPMRAHSIGPRYAATLRPNPVVAICRFGAVDVPTIVTPVVLVDSKNLDSTIIAEGFYTRQQVYGK